MIKLTSILFILFLPQWLFHKEFSYYHMGKPTAEGIRLYIMLNEQKFAEEYMHFIQDTLRDYYMIVDDLSEYNGYDTLELGRYYYPDEIIITNETKFIDYAVDSLSTVLKKLTYSNGFVKGTVFHELTHIWFQQIIHEMQYHNQYVSPEYRNFRIYYARDRGYGAGFIEEGVCEYVALKAGEILYPERTAPDFEVDWNRHEIKYRYAEFYVRQVLDNYDNLKEGIKVLLQTPPPTKDEIRNPELYYKTVFGL